jgi:hypothetical protein
MTSKAMIAVAALLRGSSAAYAAADMMGCCCKDKMGTEAPAPAPTPPAHPQH